MIAGILERSVTDIVETNIVEQRIVPQESVLLVPPARSERPSSFESVTYHIGVKPVHHHETQVGILGWPMFRNDLLRGQRAVTRGW